MDSTKPFFKSSGSAARCALATAAVVSLAVLAGLVLVTDVSASAEWQNAAPAQFATGVQDVRPYEEVWSVSCASAGNCTAVGSFTNSDSSEEAFTMTSADGSWGQARRAEFAAGVQLSGRSASGLLTSVSCVSVGNCTAVGKFRSPNGIEAFTMTSSGGTWTEGRPAEFATNVQHASPFARFNSVSCVAPGTCVAVGGFTRAAGGYVAFTMASSGGSWSEGRPVEFAPNVEHATPSATLTSVSCVSVGNCTAVGYFRNQVGDDEAFTVTLSGGTWGQARRAEFDSTDPSVPSANPSAQLYSVSCVSVGNCTAVGGFGPTTGRFQAFTVTQSGGVWGVARPAEFAANTQNTFLFAQFDSVSCVSEGNCTAVGFFTNNAGGQEAIAMTSSAGSWGLAAPVVFGNGVQASTGNRAGRLYSVSCMSVGHCTAVGQVKNAVGDYEAFTVTSSNGVWGEGRTAVFESNVQHPNPEAQFRAVACTSVGNCVAGGNMKDPNGGYRAFTMRSVDNTPVTTPTDAPTSTAPSAVDVPPTGAPTTTATTASAGVVTTVAGVVASPTSTVAAGVRADAKSTTASITFVSSVGTNSARAYDYSLDGGKTWKRAANVRATNGQLVFAIENLKPGTRYTVSVRARFGGGRTSPVGVVSFKTTLELPATGSPSGSTVPVALVVLAAGCAFVVFRRRLSSKV